MLFGGDMSRSRFNDLNSRFDWQRKRAEEKKRLKESEREAKCEWCGRSFVYHAVVGFDKPRFDSIGCKKLSEIKERNGSG